MARAKPKKNRSAREITEVIVAEWFRVLPNASDGARAPWPMDENALTAAFNEILDAPCKAAVDQFGKPINIIVPLPPAATREELIDYLAKNKEDFYVGFGTAALFGCGR